MNESVFGLSSILDVMRDTTKGAEAIEKYEALFGPIHEENEKDNVFYQENLSQFNLQKLEEYGTIRMPDCMEDEPEEVRDLLLRLIIASFSSICTLTKNEKEIIVSIAVKKTDDDGTVETIENDLDEFWFIQVLNLMKIYLEEQLFMTVLRREDQEQYWNDFQQIKTRYEENLNALARLAGKDPQAGGFGDVAGMDNLKDSLNKRIIWVLKDKEKAEKYRLSLPNGMLLYGPPGCGKTFFAQKFAEESGFHYLLVNGSDLGSIYVHGTQGKIAELFKKAEQDAPTVICFDEFDSFVPARGSDSASQREDEVNEFLSQLNNCAKRGIFVIGTTNRMDMIDPAVLRKGRMDIKVEIPAPDVETRKKMFALHLKGRPQEEDIDLGCLADLTEGYASSDIAYIVNEAAIAAALADELISTSHLEEAVKANPSSLAPLLSTRKIGFNST